MGELQLSNRIVMAPMTRCRAIDNIPNALIARYYEQRATAGLIITEGTAPSPNGLGLCAHSRYLQRCPDKWLARGH
jgi:N-ethylmaleimide reductase